MGALIKLCQERRGIQKSLTYFNSDRIIMVYVAPLPVLSTRMEARRVPRFVYCRRKPRHALKSPPAAERPAWIIFIQWSLSQALKKRWVQYCRGRFPPLICVLCVCLCARACVSVFRCRYRLPLNEVVEDFYDVIKSLSSGYASFDYEDAGYEYADVAKLSILLNGDVVDALSTITHSTKAWDKGKDVCARLKKVISRQQFDIAIQAMAKGKVIARESVKALRKDVTVCARGAARRARFAAG